jgi:hypothetical protein
MSAQRIATTILAAATLFLVTAAAAQQSEAPQSRQQQNRNGLAGTTPGAMPQKAGASDAGRAAMNSMSNSMDRSGDMNAHMFMTALRPKEPGDDERAAEIVKTVRASIGKYKDYRVALANGYHIFGPKVPQKIYHFTNYWNAMKAGFTFDPSRPTSLLYKKAGGSYALVGAMFTAPRRFSQDQLNARVPLSVARWHQHVNLCLPPRGSDIHEVNWKEFGPKGSIATKQACQDADGRWIRQIFGWMVHVYPYESNPANVWAH